jgi:hypothetical protein
MRSDRRRTATLLASVLIAGGVSILLWSCREVGTAPDAVRAVDSSLVQRPRLAEIPPEQMGAIHNDALDQVLADFETSAAAGKLHKANVQALARASLNRYFVTHGHGPITDGKWSEGSALGHAGPSDWIVVGRDGSSGVSTRANSYLDEVFASAARATSARAVTSSMERIESSARAELGGRDLSVVLASASVAKSSAEYWSTKAERWRSALCAADACGHADSATASLSPVKTRMALSPPIAVSADAADFPDGWIVLFADIFGFLAGGIMGSAIASTVAFIAQL